MLLIVNAVVVAAGVPVVVVHRAAVVVDVVSVGLPVVVVDCKCCC